MKEKNLKDIFLQNRGNQIDKWMHYFDAYERHFSRFRYKKTNVVEIGVQHGGSLKMWKEYFGKDAQIYGVDIDPRCKQFESDGFKIFIGDQGDMNFMDRLTKELPEIDILIDDGGHTMRQQINTFKALYPHISKNGVYFCEDTCTSYWRRADKENNFMKMCSELVHELNGYWHNKVTDITKTALSMHFYDGIVVIEKGRHIAPERRKTGRPVL